jgi:alginate O-acetyltransferase complex protein AlgF
MKNHSLFTAVCLPFLSLCSPSFADDNSLYAEALPADASFVRFIGFDGQDSAEFAGFTFELAADEAGKYIPVSASQLSNIAPGTYTSILRAPNGAQQTINETTRTRQSKVALLLVNGTDTELELRLADGSVDVISDVSPTTSALREVNPVAITLGVFAAGQQVPQATFEVALRRGQNLSFVADAHGIRLIENQFAPLAK